MFVIGLMALFFSWLFMLTYIVMTQKNHYKKLVDSTGKQSLDDILNTLLTQERMNTNHLKLLEQNLHHLKTEGEFHYNKIGIVRFNPFGKVTSEQSFVMALLNQKKDGIVLNFLHTHEGVRIYVKNVKMGKGEQYELSDEEKDAVNTAR